MGQRDSDHNIAVIDFVQPSSKPVIHPATTSASEWDDAALFRPRAGSRASFEVIYPRARRIGNRIDLLDPTDSTAFGSPLVVPEGVIGIVQSESTAALISSLVP